MIDWQQLTLNLRNNYKTMRAIADEIGCAEHTLYQLSLGIKKEPQFNLGIKLIDMHYDKCPEKHQSIYTGKMIYGYRNHNE